MLKEKMQMIKSKFEGKTDKKKIESLVVFIIILIVTLIAINTIWKGDSKSKNNTAEDSIGYKRLAEYVEDNSNSSTTEDELEKKLEGILSKMEGVGKVNVMITYLKGSEIVPMQNETSKVSTTQESDSDGGTRVIEQTDKATEIIYSDGTKIETQTILNPVVKGAIVIAEGASNATVKSNIVSAVEAITGLATYKVQVFEMN